MERLTDTNRKSDIFPRNDVSGKLLSITSCRRLFSHYKANVHVVTSRYILCIPQVSEWLSDASQRHYIILASASRDDMPSDSVRTGGSSKRTLYTY